MEGDDAAAELERTPTEDEHLGVCIARAVADANGVEVPNLEARLSDVVDPDALDRLFAPRPNGEPRTGGTVSFEIAGCHVTVGPDRTVVVKPAS